MSSGSKNQKIEFIRISLTLFLITAVVAVLLALANFVTEPIIERSAQERLNQSLNTLMEDASTFDDVDGYEKNVVIGDAKIPVKAVYAAKGNGGGVIGYCVQVTPTGYSDVIDMIVAINGEGAVSGVQILSIADTPGIGMKVESDTVFRESVYGLTDPAKVVKSAPTGKSEVQVITGASVSSTAYINGVSAAIETVQNLNQEVAK